MRAALLAALAILCAGCRGSAPSPGGSASSAPKDSIATLTNEGVTIALTPEQDGRSLRVEITTTGAAAAGLAKLRATAGWADTAPLAAIQDLVVADASGPIGVSSPIAKGGFTELPLARPVEGASASVRYRVTTRATSRFALHATPLGIAGVGHSFLLRPALDVVVPIAVTFHTEALGAAASGRTSMRGGDAPRSIEDAAAAVYAMGRVAIETSGRSDLVVSAFEPAVSRDALLAASHGMLKRGGALFDAPKTAASADPPEIFVIAERGIGAAHDAASFGSTIALWIDARRSFDDALRILVAHETLHRWFGGAIRVVDGARDEAWFAEGFAVHFARALLFEDGAIDAAAFAADVTRTFSGDRSDAYARGAALAARLDAKIRDKSGSKRTLAAFVRDLSADGPEVPLARFWEKIAGEIGGRDARALEAALRAPGSVTMPEGVWGPCFRTRKIGRNVLDLGFDPNSVRGTPMVLRGVVAGSAAARAGAKDGTLILVSSIRDVKDLDPEKPVELVVAERRGKKKIKFKPAKVVKETTIEPKDCGSGR